VLLNSVVQYRSIFGLHRQIDRLNDFFSSIFLLYSSSKLWDIFFIDSCMLEKFVAACPMFQQCFCVAWQQVAKPTRKSSRRCWPSARTKSTSHISWHFSARNCTVRHRRVDENEFSLYWFIYAFQMRGNLFLHYPRDGTIGHLTPFLLRIFVSSYTWIMFIEL